MMTVAISFIGFLLAFVVVGVLSVLMSKKSTGDYLLAGRNVPAWLTALSAIATNSSGFMFIGLIGMTYTMGVSGAWLMFGWIVGDYMMWRVVHPKLRDSSENNGAETFAATLAHWQGKSMPILRRVAAILTLIFLGTYAAAQLNAGSKALHVLFGWDYATGAILGAVIVLLYCVAGGIRASIWTDAAQSFVMIFAIAALLYVAIGDIGGFSALFAELKAIDPSLVATFPSEMTFGPLWGPILFVAGWIFAGMGIIGQPHIMVRFMAIDSVKSFKKARRYYFGWYIAFTVMAILVGLSARVLIPDTASFDAELALPQLADDLLPDVLVGLILAALFAATMSTADSQVLSCSSALTQDFTKQSHDKEKGEDFKEKHNYLLAKFGTFLVTVVALVIALYGSKSVFQLVTVSWSALASAFAPLLFILAVKRPFTQIQGLFVMTVGLVAMFVWRHLGLSAEAYEVMPGIVFGLAAYPVARVLFKEKMTAKSEAK